MDGEMLRVGEVANLLGVSTDILRRWDKDEKLVPIRTLGGHRRYRKADIEEKFGIETIDNKPNLENTIVEISKESPLLEPCSESNYFDGFMLSDLGICDCRGTPQIKFGTKSKQFAEYTKSILEIETETSFCNIYENDFCPADKEQPC